MARAGEIGLAHKHFMAATKRRINVVWAQMINIFKQSLHLRSLHSINRSWMQNFWLNISQLFVCFKGHIKFLILSKLVGGHF